MVERLPSSSQPIRSKPVTGEQPPRRAESSVATGAAFQVLLEKLEGEAHGLHRQSNEIESPKDLSQAVDRARESLTQAFQLRDQLLEAWRASRAGEAK